MQNFGERVAAARTASEGARSASGLVSAAASLIGLRLEARAPPQQVLGLQATLTDQALRAESLNVPVNVRAFGADGADDGRRT